MIFEDTLARVEKALQRGGLNQIEKLVLRHSWEGHSYSEIAEITGYDSGYLKDTGSKLWQSLSKICGEKVTKHNLQGVLRRFLQTLEANEPQLQSIQTTALARIRTTTSSQPQQDWGDAIDVSIFYGRSQELETLQQWIVEDRCHLVTLLGMGGMGKTSLSVKVSETIGSQFDCLIWRSLRDAPPLDDLLIELIQFVSQQQDTGLPDSTGGKLSCLVRWLRQSRCLIILDNFETVLQGGVQNCTNFGLLSAFGEASARFLRAAIFVFSGPR